MIYMIRHGQTELNNRQVLQGRSDHPLNETGIRQAREAAERLNYELMRGRLAGETQGWISKDAMRQHFGGIK